MVTRGSSLVSLTVRWVMVGWVAPLVVVADGAMDCGSVGSSTARWSHVASASTELSFLFCELCSICVFDMYVLYVCVLILCVHMPKGVYVYMNDWILWYQFVMDSIMEIRTHEGTLSSRDGMQWAESSFSWLWRSKCPQWGSSSKEDWTISTPTHERTHPVFGSTMYSSLHGVPMLKCNTVYSLQGCWICHQVCEPRSMPLMEVHTNIVGSLKVSLKTVQKLFINSVAERDYSAQETCHLLLQLPVIHSSRDFVVLSVWWISWGSQKWLTSTVCQWQTMSSAICDISKRDHQPIFHENLCFHHSWTHWHMYLLKP